jgi:hypothetical protein
MEKKRIESKKDAAKRATENRTFEKPKLTYVKPTLVKHGDARKITAGFFGPFSP